ncbi:type II toxin-antitoxin system Phd/YefM family antitoxin [Kribbella sp. NPDC051620]|uniref:type II toxin-antitoxin system Phd/YefM family antitoxin n=1 Tax=Kribbella sp. NPDC051620 TaxID=3364120 RepID=UPI0037AE2B8F
MDTVGFQQLRHGLGRYLEDVSQGRSYTITRHGKPVARLVPIQAASNLERLVAEGRATAPSRPKRPAPIPTPADGTVSDLIDELRR